MGSRGGEVPYLYQLPGAQLKGRSPFPQYKWWDYEDLEPRTPKMKELVFLGCSTPPPGLRVGQGE